MKQIIALIVFILLVDVSTNRISAASCRDIIDPTECGYNPYCRVDPQSGKCIENENPSFVISGNRASSILPLIDPLKSKYNTPAETINALLPYLLSGAGLILFGMLIAGGFQYLTAAGDAKKAGAGRSRITAAIIGFIIVFAAYWITQILEIILGINILK